jgi:P4 family phage/plasmid primase-like protien
MIAKVAVPSKMPDALALATLGYAVFPIIERNPQSTFRKEATTDEQTIREYWGLGHWQPDIGVYHEGHLYRFGRFDANGKPELTLIPRPAKQSKSSKPPKASKQATPAATSNATPSPVSIDHLPLNLPLNSPLNLPLKISVFEHVSLQPGGMDTTWENVIKTLSNPPSYASKAECALFNFAVFGEARNDRGNLRHNNNVLECYGVVGDYDGEQVSVDEAVSRLRGLRIEAVVYTSPTHTPDKPRWRVVVPFRSAHSPALHATYVDLLNGALGGILNAESWTLSQCYYFGRVTEHFRCEHVATGTCLDDALIGMLVAPVGKPGSMPERDRLRDQAPRQPVEVTDETMVDLSSALDYLAEHTERANDRALWIETGHALASLKGTPYGEEAFELWDTFSQASSKYNEAEMPDRWDGLRADRITHASIFHWAQAAGWRNPRASEITRAVDVFHVQDPSTAEQQARLVEIEERMEHLAQPEFALTTWDDVGNANLLRNLTDGNLRYVVDLEKWIVWDGERWTMDHDGSLALAQARRVGNYYKSRAEQEEEAARQAGDEKERKSRIATVNTLTKWSAQCWTNHRLSSMLHQLRSDLAVRTSSDKLNANPWLIGVQNGVVDLKTGTLRPAAREDLITRRAAVAFDPDAPCPLWEKTVCEITGTPIPAEKDEEGTVIPGTVGRFTPRPEMVQYLQRCAGYWLTGSIAEHVMFFFYGPPGGGKNLLLDVMHEVVGDYATTIDTDALMTSGRVSSRDAATPTIASLEEVRAAFGSETKPEQHWDEKTIKWLTGDAHLTARRPHGQKVDFRNTGKLICYGNHAPKFNSTEYAMHGRIHTIPCLRQWNRPTTQMYDPALPDGDKTLLDRIRAKELPGVLAWMVRGCVGYLANGLQAPADVAQATQAYVAKQGRIGQWVETLERVPVEDGTPAAQLLEAFLRSQAVALLSTAERVKFNPTMFAAELERLGVEKKKTRTGNVWGLRLPLSSAGRAALETAFG